MKKPTRKSLTRKLDFEWARVIKLPGKCVWCNSEKELQAAHIFSRSIRSTRWLVFNGLPLCASCHFKAHLKPIEFAEFTKQYLGEYNYQALRIQATSIKKWKIWELVELLQILEGVR